MIELVFKCRFIFTLHLSIIDIPNGSQNYSCMTSLGVTSELQLHSFHVTQHTHISVVCSWMWLAVPFQIWFCSCVSVQAADEVENVKELVHPAGQTARLSVSTPCCLNSPCVYLPAYFKTKHHGCCSTQQDKKSKISSLPTLKSFKLCIKYISL